MNINDILPKLFAWCSVPAGMVTLGGNLCSNGGYITQATSFEVSAFAIAKYPVTNAQFRKFVEAGGYGQPRWWTNTGWEAKERYSWNEPSLWREKRWNQSNCPVVGVSWYEAVAFCQWLTELVQEKISLPTEQQWQWSAQALPDGRNSGNIYPWGPEWDVKRCNSCVERDQQKNRISPVTLYDGRGNSPCGVVDLSGNVREWCLTAYQTGSDTLDSGEGRVLRGGAWISINPGDCRVDCRFQNNPLGRVNSWGFRLSRSSSP